ncbi:hypothetical protein JW960_15320 [candidate division KSB1 bacterium]|nr:hypothetical protein [candidate division KSB1 bacterium]
MVITKKLLATLVLTLMTAGVCRAQFLDTFDNNKIDGWFDLTGDGTATMQFIPMNGFARIAVDATHDRYNVYWTLIKRNVASFFDLNELKNPDYELRVEARVRVHNAPRRINMMVNTQRTTNFHIDLLEFDIPDTTEWHTVSMTTTKLDAVPGDSLYVQLCVTDYGPGKYNVDLDYYRADIINVKQAGPDKGVRVPYHPPIPDVSTFTHHLNVKDDALINSDFPDVNFNDWSVTEQTGYARTLTVNANQWAILRWELAQFKNAKITGSGLLELTTQSVPRGGDYIAAFGEDFGIEFEKIRVIEILGGDPQWDQNTVTYDNFIQDKNYEDIFNTQMIYDGELADEPGDKSYFTISQPVLQRMLDGTTKGLLIRPLGALDASFYASENNTGNDGPKLHLNISE